MVAYQAAESSDFRPVPLDSTAITVRGKFFFQATQKLFLKGVTYGPFSPAAHGAPFPEKPVVEQDLAMIAELGANCLRTFTVPPDWLLDLAAALGLRVIIGIPWSQHICFLNSPALQAEIRQTIAAAVRACRNQPAAFAYLVGNEIPPDIVRWHGPKRIRAFLSELVAAAKEADPQALISYANYPSTEYLKVVDLIDFLSFNVYLHREADFRRYLARLQNLAEDKPLVLTEFGIDSIREGQEGQAEMLAWTTRAAFESGVAGTTIFSWTDDWYTLSGEGGFQVEDWAFGLVDRERCRKPAFQAVQQEYKAPLPPRLPEYPKVSVVVCAYNAERSLDSCLASLKKLHYPDYEVIVVNDGSTDCTPAITQRYDYVRIINQQNRGVGEARNAGIAAATGEIVAFTDADCTADPDWLAYLVAQLQSSGFVAVGGPNYPPPEDALVPSCIAAAPGGPTHVLLSDQVAEHIPGCNMAFRRQVLQEIGGFDPIFHAAGDDVDICWRLQDQGHSIGFSPVAVVWHFRRASVAAYIRQQRGYGKAEALLYFKHPQRFNMLGQARWLGRIYGDPSSTLLYHWPIIYSGIFGRGPFQMLYESQPSTLWHLPLTLEWNVAAVTLFAGALLSGSYLGLGAAPLLLTWGLCVARALRARLDPRFPGIRPRLLVALLTYVGPLARSLERYRWWMRRLSDVEPIAVSQKLRVSWPERAFYLSYWTEAGLEKEILLQEVMNYLLERKYFITQDHGWSNWDMEILQGIWSKAQIKVCSENHGGSKRLLRVRCALKMSQLASMTVGGCLLLAVMALALALPVVAAVIAIAGCIAALTALYQNVRLGRILYRVLEDASDQMQLVPVSGLPRVER